MAGVTSAANKLFYFTGSGTGDVTDFTAYGRSLVGVADEAAFKALVNLEIGTDVQAYNATLTSWAGIAPATKLDASAVSAFALTFLDDADAGAVRTTIGAAATSHTHAISDVTNLQTTLDGKAASSHTHAISDVTNLQTTLDGKVASSHSHAISDVTGLQSALDDKLDDSQSTTIGTGKQTIWIPAGAMIARTTNGAASGTTELATNDVMLRTLDFDQTTEEGAQFMVAMPKGWNESTVSYHSCRSGRRQAARVVSCGNWPAVPFPMTMRWTRLTARARTRPTHSSPATIATSVQNRAPSRLADRRPRTIW
jgi:hypothetical protein